MPEKSRIVSIRPADENNQVITVESSSHFKAYRRQPCAQCPWRKDAVGVFPAEAFRHSASTAYDMARTAFGCHESGGNKPATCAGFLLRGAGHSMAARLDIIAGRIDPSQVHSDVELHGSYRDMAVANGVGPDEPVLRRCR